MNIIAVMNNPEVLFSPVQRESILPWSIRLQSDRIFFTINSQFHATAASDQIDRVELVFKFHI
jgi:hypothetical protein